MTQSPPPNSFAARLSRAREIGGATRQQVAEASGVSEFTVGAWERGDETNPTLAALAGISALLGVSVDWLIHGPGTASAVERARRAADAYRTAKKPAPKKKAAGE